MDEFRERIEKKIDSIDKTINGNGVDGMKDRITRIEVNVDEIKKDIVELKAKPLTPCEVHSQRMNGLSGQVSWLWALLLLNISAIGTGFWIMLRLK